VATVPGRPGTEPVYRITSVRRSYLEETHQRTVRYLVSMGVRTACFLLAVVVHGPLRWVLVLAAIVLPYIAVVFANAGRERSLPTPPEIFLRPDRTELPGTAQAPPREASPEATTGSGLPPESPPQTPPVTPPDISGR
jgi:hypothetical protein